MKVIKKSGDVVEYDRRKLRNSLLRSGVPENDLERIFKTVEVYLYDGIQTKQIHKFVKRLLKKVPGPHAARYNLRSALEQLGPAGFFFERFVALVFEAEGYQTKTNLYLKGKCVSHEIDIVIRKADRLTMAECKFHAQSGTKSDVKVPMYILSRFNDVKDNAFEVFSGLENISACKIVTNNRFTTDAEAFARCSGLELLSWDYPLNDSLKTKIDNMQLYPVTCLMTLSAIEKEKLLVQGIILALQLVGAPDSLVQIGISEGRRKRIVNEAAGLCNYF